MPAPSSDCLCIGIAVADHLCPPLHHMPAPGELVTCPRLELGIGGCAANVATDLAKLEVNVSIVARVGHDFFGRFMREELEAAGVRTEHLQVSTTSQTSGSLVINVQGQDRRFIHAFGANGEFDGAEITPELIRSTRVLYVGGFFVMPRLTAERVAEMFQIARAAGVKTVLDVVLPEPGDYWPALKTVLPHTDVFLPNSDEGQIITGLTDPVAQAEQFHAAGAATAVVTCGGEGAVLISGEERFRSAAHRVQIIDGTGSGDAFDAGYISGLLHGASPRECVARGSALGASCVRASGATAGVFTRPELEAFLQQNRLDITPL